MQAVKLTFFVHWLILLRHCKVHAQWPSSEGFGTGSAQFLYFLQYDNTTPVKNTAEVVYMMNNNIYYNKINIEGGNGFRSIVFCITSLYPVKALWHSVCKSICKLLSKTTSTKTSQTAPPPCFDRFKKHS